MRPRSKIAPRVTFRSLLALSFLGWSIYGLVSTAQAVVFLAARNDSRPLFQVAGTTFVMMWLWATFTPVIFVMALRFPLRRGMLGRSLAVHGAMVVILTLVDALVRQVVYPAFGFNPVSVVAAYMRFFEVNFFAYIAIAGIAHVYEMGGRLQREALDKSRLEADLAQAQLLALKMQIQPHFLFNTLHGIAEIVHEDASQADRMITRLGELLRMTMETSGAQEVPLRREVELLRAYLAIQEARFGDRLEVEYDIGPMLGDALVPSFLLQPLVENALQHGIAKQPGPGRITIRAWRRDGTLHIAVRDDGEGVGGQYTEGLGIRNTRARLEHLYGGSAAFALEPADGRTGAVASVELPFRPAGSAPTSAEDRR